MQNCIEYLEDPAKVAAIQKFFGVYYNRRAPVRSIPENEYTNEESLVLGRESSGNSPDISNNNHSQNNASNHFETGTTIESDKEKGKNYVIKYKFWYYFFISLTHLGDVIGYALVLPFLFWNVDGVITRKLVLVWTVVMYVGQAVKEIVCRERPKCPPVIRLQCKWSEEYGMPSTHAMASVALPASLLYYGIQRHKFHLGFGIPVSLVWCILISFSRLYLGMHSILDVIAGFLLSFLLLIPLLFMMDFVGDDLIKFPFFPLVIIALSLLLIVMYPKPNGTATAHTSTDTTIILATCVGVEIGCWLNYNLNYNSNKSSARHPYPIKMPEWNEIGLIALRTISGLICIVISLIIFEFVVKKITYLILNKIKCSNTHLSNSNKNIPIIDLCLKYLTYCISSMHVTFSIPLLFKWLYIHRPSYFTE